MNATVPRLLPIPFATPTPWPPHASTIAMLCVRGPRVADNCPEPTHAPPLGTTTSAIVVWPVVVGGNSTTPAVADANDQIESRLPLTLASAFDHRSAPGTAVQPGGPAAYPPSFDPLLLTAR